MSSNFTSKWNSRHTSLCAGTLLLALTALNLGCRSASTHRAKADEAAYAAVRRAQQQALGHEEPFRIERPADTLRRRLLKGQQLPTVGAAALGVDQLTPPKHWPRDDYASTNGAPSPQAFPAGVMRISLTDAVQIAAANNSDYQSQKEDVFKAALALDLEKDAFRSTFSGTVGSRYAYDGSGETRQTGTENSGELGISRMLIGGAELSAQLGLDLVNLLTGDRVSAYGVNADVSASIPLLRGAGRHIKREALTQAERSTVYAIQDFEQFKRSFAVETTSRYLNVLTESDKVRNAEENYLRIKASTERAQRLAEAGNLPEIQVDQSRQDELRARNRWISAQQAAERSLDEFKGHLGLPPDAQVDLDPQVLGQLTSQALAHVDQPRRFETMKPEQAVQLALQERPDLVAAVGRVEDAQRKVIVAADALRAEITLLGQASVGGGRSIGNAAQGDARPRPSDGRYSALLTLDLGLERTAERNAYRESYIQLEAAIRQVQSKEDDIKLRVRSDLRRVREQRESVEIQQRSVEVARRRQKSVNLFLQAGRAEIRDMLEAQEALLNAQNGLTRAVVDYRLSELELQRDLGLLRVDHNGLWTEVTAEEMNNVEE